MDKDVTELVEHGWIDMEDLPLTQCVCGAKFPVWTRIITIYRDWAEGCPHCGRRLYFVTSIRVYEVVDNAET